MEERVSCSLCQLVLFGRDVLTELGVVGLSPSSVLRKQRECTKTTQRSRRRSQIVSLGTSCFWKPCREPFCYFIGPFVRYKRRRLQTPSQDLQALRCVTRRSGALQTWCFKGVLVGLGRIVHIHLNYSFFCVFFHKTKLGLAQSWNKLVVHSITMPRVDVMCCKIYCTWLYGGA